MKREYQLGKDLNVNDSLLDGVTFDDLVLALYCNHSQEKITPATVRLEFSNIIRSRLVDAEWLLGRNIDEIIKYAQDYYN